MTRTQDSESKGDAPVIESRFLQKLVNKSMTKEELLQKICHNFDLIPEVVKGVSSPKATIRYGCAKVLMDLSEKHPKKLYLYMDFFTSLLDSKYRILKWNTMAIIANLACVDKDKKFDAIFNKYYSFINDPYMVTVANVVGHTSKIAVAKPYLVQKITNELLKVENITTTPHLTEECKRVIAEKTIESFDKFFDQINNKDQVISFVKRNLDSPRETLRKVAQNFIAKWGK
jgi:ribosomal protein L17